MGAGNATVPNDLEKGEPVEGVVVQRAIGQVYFVDERSSETNSTGIGLVVLFACLVTVMFLVAIY